VLSQKAEKIRIIILSINVAFVQLVNLLFSSRSNPEHFNLLGRLTGVMSRDHCFFASFSLILCYHPQYLIYTNSKYYQEEKL